MVNKLREVLSIATFLVVGLTAMAVHADSSSLSSAASESVGSLSTSIQKSSASSSERKVTQGRYTVMEVANVGQQPDMLRLRLQAQPPLRADAFFLLLPRRAAGPLPVAKGDTVEVQQRAYGVAFATVGEMGANLPFFLVLDDDWYQELGSHPVSI
jgi:hypothetical protein